MNARFYIGLVSISFGATAWGMHHTPDHEALFAIKHSRPMLAPVHIERNFGSPVPHSHSAPAALSYVSASSSSPKTPKRPISALGKTTQSPQNKVLVKKESNEGGQRSASLPAVPDMSKQAITPCPTCSTPLVLVAASTLSKISIQKS